MKIFVSDRLQEQFPEVWAALPWIEAIVSENIWVRDFMPIQVGDHYVKFGYDAAGEGAPPNELFYHDLGRLELNDILLDGGNIQMIGGKAFVTDIVFEKNDGPFTRKGLHHHLEAALECEVVVIPNDDDDFYGHADGILAAGPGNTVFINSKATHKKAITKKLNKMGHEVVALPCPREKMPYYDSLSAFGYYINLLVVDDTIYFPTFDVKEDDEVESILSAVAMKVRPVPCRKLSMRGGCVHCVTREYR